MFNSYLFRVIFIPAGVYVSVMFGGGAATGLEIAAYMSSNGPVGGLLAIGIIALIYIAVIFLCFELGRLYQSYDYQSFSKLILGKLFFLYEITVTLAMLGVIAYSTTGGGTAFADLFGISRHLVTAIILVLVIYLLYKGRRLVEVTMVATTVLLLATALALALGTIYTHGDTISRELQNTSIVFPDLANRVWVYAVAVTAFTPVLLFAARDLKTRIEVLFAAVACAAVISIPPVCMHLAYLSHYPEALDKAIPNAWISGQVMPDLFTGFFVIILNIVILQTAVGSLQGIIELADAWKIRQAGQGLGSRTHAGIATACLLVCMGLSVFGVQRLLGWMYEIYFWLFLAVFLLPLVTVGSYRIVRGQRPS